MSFVKDGPTNVQIQLLLVDEAKPKVSVSGHSYVFNSLLVFKRGIAKEFLANYIISDEFRQDVLAGILNNGDLATLTSDRDNQELIKCLLVALPSLKLF